LERAEIQAEIAVPILSVAAKDKSTDPDRARLALEALRRVKGAEDYLKKKIDELSETPAGDGDFERCEHMRTLSLIGSNKAVRTLASFLFDERTQRCNPWGRGFPLE
jgi:hypothetical protein